MCLDNDTYYIKLKKTSLLSKDTIARLKKGVTKCVRHTVYSCVRGSLMAGNPKQTHYFNKVSSQNEWETDPQSITEWYKQTFTYRIKCTSCSDAE